MFQNKDTAMTDPLPDYFSQSHPIKTAVSLFTQEEENFLMQSPA
jgi:hypothetical protein